MHKVSISSRGRKVIVGHARRSGAFEYWFEVLGSFQDRLGAGVFVPLSQLSVLSPGARLGSKTGVPVRFK